MRHIKTFLLLIIVIGVPFILLSSIDRQFLKVEVRNLDNDTYRIFYQGNLDMDYVTTRPNKDDPNVFLSVAGAFTNMNNNKIDGLYIVNGTVGNRSKINKSLGGGLIINNGNCKMIETNRGSLLTDSLIESLSSSKSSFFQQIYMIVDGKAESFRDKKKFQRRAIVIFKDDRSAIIENSIPKTLTDFCNDLVGFGVKDAMYVDMGTWDEGWYRTENSVEVIGNSRKQTNRQSNWVIFTNR